MAKIFNVETLALHAGVVTTVEERPWSLVLAPIDQGTRNVGGRPGACKGPERLLAGLRKRERIPEDARIVRLDVANTRASLEEDLDALSEAVEQALVADRLPIVLGGDHGTTYATVRAAARALGEVGVGYLDVHLDVRGYEPEHTSGSSFRRLIEEEWVKPEQVHPLGIQKPSQPGQASGEKASFAELQAWAEEQGVGYRWLEQVQDAPQASLEHALSGTPSWCFSIDVDALDRRWAPGVSAPGDDRFTLDQACQVLQAARGRYRVLDIVEYAPPLDEDERTLRSCLDLLEAALPEANASGG